jgi:integrase
MSQENVEVVGAAMTAFNARDRDRALSMCDPEIELWSPFEQKTYRGLDEMVQWREDLAALVAAGHAPSTVNNIVAALRALVAWALPRGYVHNDPCSRLRLPRGGKRRERVATPTEAARLIAALLPQDQVALGLAVYAGLRIGELLALDVSAIDWERQTLAVMRGWDPDARQFIATKSRKSRTIPISSRLGELLADHLVLLDHPSDGLLFVGRDPRYPTHPRVLRRRTAKTWKVAGLEPLGFHEARHTFASTAIAAGMNAKTLCTLMGHASISVTYDTYGHLLRGNESEARDLLDTYLDRQDS